MSKFENGKDITEERVQKFCKDKASEITPDIYLGNLIAANNKEHLQEIGITHIIRIGTDLKDFHQKTFNYLSLDLWDDKDEIIYHYFHTAYYFIEKCREKKGKVFIHCYAGVCRSATLVISYLMKKNNIDTQVAFKMVEKGREIVWPNEGFFKQLDEYYIREIADHTKNNVKRKYRCYSTYNIHKKPQSHVMIGISKPEIGKHSFKKCSTKIPRRKELIMEENKIKLYKKLDKEFEDNRELPKPEIRIILEKIVKNPAELIKTEFVRKQFLTVSATKLRNKKLSNLITRYGKKMIDDIMLKERVPIEKIKPLFVIQPDF